MSVYFAFQYIRYIIYCIWQSIYKTVFSKFVLYSECVHAVLPIYVVLPTCVEVVNATVLIK